MMRLLKERYPFLLHWRLILPMLFYGAVFCLSLSELVFGWLASGVGNDYGFYAGDVFVPTITVSGVVGIVFGGLGIVSASRQLSGPAPRIGFFELLAIAAVTFYFLILIGSFFVAAV